MAFSGSLLAFKNDSGGYDNFSLEYIFKESYAITPNRRQDLDSTRNANGRLVRNVLDHTATSISFTSKPMWGKDMDKLNEFLYSHFILSTKQKKCKIRYYSPDLRSYKEGNFYLADVEYPVLRVDMSTSRILYNSTTFEFIEY